MRWSTMRELYSSKTASEITSEVYWIGDAATVSLQLVGSPSTTTIQSSNDDGRSAAITNWSTLSTNINGGQIDIAAGPGWLRLLRSETTAANLRLQNEAI